MKWLRDLWRKLWRAITGDERGHDTPSKPPSDGWRDGYEIVSLPAKDGRVAFWTRNVALPTGPNVPRSDLEYIICEIRGDNLSRGLIIVFPAPRISRIGFDPGGAPFERPFPVPLAGPSFWEVCSDGTAIWIKLDGREIARDRSRAYTVRHVIMGSPTPGRGFKGQWVAA